MEIVIAGLMYLGIMTASEGNDQMATTQDDTLETSVIVEDSMDD